MRGRALGVGGNAGKFVSQLDVFFSGVISGFMAGCRFENKDIVMYRHDNYIGIPVY